MTGCFAINGLILLFFTTQRRVFNNPQTSNREAVLSGSTPKTSHHLVLEKGNDKSEVWL